jgi:CIC family chloride channel protein
MRSRSRDSRLGDAPLATGNASAGAGARWSSVGSAAFGALLGGLVGGLLVVGVTLLLKAGMDFVARQETWFIVVAPLVGLSISVLVLYGIGTSATTGTDRKAHAWRTFAPEVARADISADVVNCAGEEERFPWRLAPIRALAILATVGSGAAMGTEAPAAYLGLAAGDCLGDRGRGWRRFLRPAALAGGAAGVAALMAIPLVGTAFMLEIGRRRRAPLSAERLTAALIGGFIGWAINATFHLNLIRLIVPKEPPVSLVQAVLTALFIGTASGAISSCAGVAVYRAKKWKASPLVRLALGGVATVVTALVLMRIAAPSAASGPGGGAILWAETVNALPLTLLAVCLLRALATTAAVAAGGCGGVFVPFLAAGDLAGRVFAPGLGIGNDLAGAAGAAGGIAGGYRLPFTAVAMELGLGGPPKATLTCLATIGIATLAGLGAESALGKLKAVFARRRGGGATTDEKV